MDPALIVVDALRHAGLDASPDAIRSYIEGLHSWPGSTGCMISAMAASAV